MNFDNTKTTTERQLVAALAADGRIVSPKDITNWRKNGLLRPLTSHGLGPGKGKAYRWHDEDLVARAAVIFDAMKKQRRNDSVVITLFLSGFEVSLPKLRRAWTAHVKLRKPLAFRKTTGANRLPILDINGLLLQPILAMRGAIGSDEHSAFVAHAVEQGLARLGYGAGVTAEQLCRIITMTAMALQATDLMQTAPAMEIYEAQRYLTMAVTFLDDGKDRRGRLIEAIGAALFTFVLALLHSGQNAVLESIAAHIEDMDRPAPRKPVHAFRVPAPGIGAADQSHP